MRLGSLLLVIAFVAILSSAQAPRTEKKADQTEAHETRRDIDFWFLPHPEVHSQPQERPAEDKTQKWQEWFWPPVWSNWALVAIAGIAACAAFRTLAVIRHQVRLMRRQTSVMERQTAALEQQGVALVNSERAWVVVSNQRPAVVRMDGKSMYYEFRFDLVNHGRTVAKIVGAFPHQFRLTATGEQLPEVPDYGPLYRPERDDLPPIHGMIPAPGESLQDLPMKMWRVEPEGTIESIMSGERRVYVYALLKYFDFADRERALQLCYRYVGAGTDFSGNKTEAKWLMDGPTEYNKHT